MEKGARFPTTEVLGWRSRRKLCQMSLRDMNAIYLLQIRGSRLPPPGGSVCGSVWN